MGWKRILGKKLEWEKFWGPHFDKILEAEIQPVENRGAKKKLKKAWTISHQSWCEPAHITSTCRRICNIMAGAYLQFLILLLFWNFSMKLFCVG